MEIQNSEAVSFAFSATDSRGYPASALVEPTVIPYIPLTINPTFRRVSPTSNIITVEFYGNFFSGNFGAFSNALKVKYRYKEYGTETWSAYVTISSSSINIPGDGTYNSNGAVTLGSNFDYRKSYDLEIVAQDGSGTSVLSEVSSMAQVTRGEPVFDWSNTDFRVRETLRTANVEPDGEMSIGTNEKPYSTGYFNQIYIGGNPVSVIEEEGTSGIWYYRKWSSGIAECWLLESKTITGSPGSIIGNAYYISTTLTDFPAIFSEPPRGYGSGRLGSGIGWLTCIPREKRAITLFITGNANSTEAHVDSVMLTGRWK